MELYSDIENIYISYERESCYKDSPKFEKEIEVVCDLPETNPALNRHHTVTLFLYPMPDLKLQSKFWISSLLSVSPTTPRESIIQLTQTNSINFLPEIVTSYKPTYEK